MRHPPRTSIIGKRDSPSCSLLIKTEHGAEVGFVDLLETWSNPGLPNFPQAEINLLVVSIETIVFLVAVSKRGSGVSALYRLPN